MRNSKFIIVWAILFLVGCSTGTKHQKIEIVNPKFPENTKKQAERAKQMLNIHFAKCKKEAYARVPYPRSTRIPESPKPRSYGIYNSYGSRVGTLEPESSYGVAPDFSSIVRGYMAARNSPSSIYKSAIRKYTVACMQEKGWRMKKLK